MAAHIFKDSLLQQKRRLIELFLFLGGLAVAQSLFLVLIKSFVVAMFASPDATLMMSDVISAKLLAFWPDVADQTFPREQLVIAVPLAVLGAGVMQAVMTYGFQVSQQAISLRMAKDIRDRIFHGLMKLPYYRSAHRSPASWMSIMMNDVLFVQMRFSDILTGVVKGGVLIVAGLLFLVVVHWQSALILTIVAPFIALGMGRAGRRIALYAEEYQRHLGRLSAAVLQVRNRFEFMRAHDAEVQEYKIFAEANQNYYRSIRKSILIRSAFAPGLEFVGVAIFALFVFATGKGWMAIGREDMFYFFVATGILLRPLRMFGEQIARGQETLGALKESAHLIDQMDGEPSDQKAVESPRPLPEELHITALAAGIDETIFATRDITLQRGRAIAIVGPSGSGKSTLIKTLAGLLPPKEWAGNVTAEELAGCATFVSQEPFLFSGTLRENLAYGLADPPSEDQMWAVLQRVGMAEEWKELGADLDSPVHAIAGNLSGGQLQRLVVARGWLRQRDLYLLDEATSAVDAEREAMMVEDMVGFCHRESKYLLVVTHRMRHLGRYDEVWFIEDGALVARGAHQELLQQQRYREYVEVGG